MNKGVYCLVLHLAQPTMIDVGKWGSRCFEPGYYCYVGSALNNLEKRIVRHLRKDKKRHWHIDYLREHASVEGIGIVRTDQRVECQLSRRIERRAGMTLPGFGSSDCRCTGHLHYFKVNPMSDSLFDALENYGDTGVFPTG